MADTWSRDLIKEPSSPCKNNSGLKRRKLHMLQADNGEMTGKTCMTLTEKKETVVSDVCPKFAYSSICGRRRYMEDFISIHPSFCSKEKGDVSDFHYFGVYDGHGCSHVAKRCQDRLHELVKEELKGKVVLESMAWKEAMERSFSRMDNEVITCKEAVVLAAECKCILPSTESDAVGSTAVVAIVTPDKIVVANCGDSRAVLSRKGKAIPLSRDHKPDRRDELSRIEATGGRVIYWDGPRVMGVLAMSRAIGDCYLKPYVTCEPEVTIVNRMAEDDCLILASDGLWDMVSNRTACGVARMCLDGKLTMPETEFGCGNYDESCAKASLLLTKLALLRQSSDNVSVVVVNLKKNT